MRPRNFFLLTAALGAAACDGGDKTSVERVAASPPPRSATEEAVPRQPDQKLIRTADLSVQVGDVNAALERMESAVQRFDGLVANKRVNRDDSGRGDAHVVVRVPSERLDGILADLRGLGEVKGETVRAQDVTREYLDLETRLAVKEQTIARLRSLLANQTGRLADVIEVERELARAVTELEQMKGERRYYDQQVALSSITLSLFERAPSRRVQFAAPIRDAVRESVEVLGRSLAAAIYLIVFLVPWIAIATPVWFGIRWMRRRNGLGARAAPTTPEPR